MCAICDHHPKAKNGRYCNNCQAKNLSTVKEYDLQDSLGVLSQNCSRDQAPCKACKDISPDLKHAMDNEH